jgi:hypothetical protein
LRGLGEINCIKKDLFHVPSFRNEGSYDLLDLRKNHIRYIPRENLEKFGIIDIRENNEFDCEDLRKMIENRVFPLIVSDCENVLGKRNATASSVPARRTSGSSSSPYHYEKNMRSSSSPGEREVRPTVTLVGLPFTTGFLNLSNIWVSDGTGSFFAKNLLSKMNSQMTVYNILTITIIVSITGILVTVFCGRKILKKCRNPGFNHNILQEEEETSFSMAELPTNFGGSLASDRGMKQE